MKASREREGAAAVGGGGGGGGDPWKECLEVAVQLALQAGQYVTIIRCYFQATALYFIEDQASLAITCEVQLKLQDSKCTLENLTKINSNHLRSRI
ncbi:hypothetical protein JRQ81_012577 [Phrynocephalus forsythii]|uniref:Uncharacterized protein n=1 Tax=Phrynocephalus forsythii TaxID=171643 RepID=A0A9Q1B622_9SAUR|nr:hypothetical protein JRQ81_012577 [Phrynocephalus forsythii]